MSYATASSLCFFGYNPKIRETINALLAEDHATASSLLADAFIDMSEQLDREQIAAKYEVEEVQEAQKEDAEYVEFLRGEMEEAAADAERYKKELIESRRQIALLQEQLEEALADAKHQRKRAEAAELKLEDAVLDVKDYEEQVDELRAQLLHVWVDSAMDAAEHNEAMRAKEESQAETTPVTPVPSSLPPLEFAPNGCLMGCGICASEQEAEEQVYYADGTPFNPKKKLTFEDVLVK